MSITLQDVFYTAGIIAFVLFSVSSIALLAFVNRVSKKIDKLYETGEHMLEQAVKSKYLLQIGLMKWLIGFLGGDKHYE